MERPLLADIQQKTFDGNRGGWPMDLIAHTATQGLYLRHHSKFGGRMHARGRMADCSDPAHAWSTYQICGHSSFWAWLKGPLNSQDRPGSTVAAAEGVRGAEKGVEVVCTRCSRSGVLRRLGHATKLYR